MHHVFNSFRFDAEIYLFAFLLTSNTLSSILIQGPSRNTQIQILTIAKLAAPSSTILKSSFENVTCQKRSWIKFEKFARTFCRNVGTFGANLCKLFPDLQLRHSMVGQETWKSGGHAWTVLTVATRNNNPLRGANEWFYYLQQARHMIKSFIHPIVDYRPVWIIVIDTRFHFSLCCGHTLK